MDSIRSVWRFKNDHYYIRLSRNFPTYDLGSEIAKIWSINLDWQDVMEEVPSLSTHLNYNIVTESCLKWADMKQAKPMQVKLQLWLLSFMWQICNKSGYTNEKTIYICTKVMKENHHIFSTGKNLKYITWCDIAIQVNKLHESWQSCKMKSSLQ